MVVTTFSDSAVKSKIQTLDLLNITIEKKREKMNTFVKSTKDSSGKSSLSTNNFILIRRARDRWKYTQKEEQEPLVFSVGKVA